MATQGLNLSLRTNATPQQLLKELLLSPLIYIRLAGILCSIIVFGCVADQVAPVTLSTNPLITCGYNGSGACSFAIAIGVIGFLLCLVFLVKDVVYVIVDYSENIVVKKVILLVDAVTNGIWAFMWFVCFCYTADQLRNYSFPLPLSSGAYNCAGAGIAFSFFCILIWVAIVVVNVIYFILIIRRSRTEGSGYTSFPEGPTDQPYQGSEGETQPQYTPPEY